MREAMAPPAQVHIMTRVGALEGRSMGVLVKGGVYSETVLPIGTKSASGEGGGMEVVMVTISTQRKMRI